MRPRPPVAAQRSARDDRGLILVIAAGLLTAMVVMAALTVDLGAAYSERRQDQSAADAAALAAAQDLPDKADAVATAKSVAAATLGETITDDQWDSCADNAEFAVPTGYTKHVGASCIAFNGSARRIFVRIPVREYEAAFSGVVGVDTFEHTAFAVAGVEPAGFGGVLPFALAVGSGTFTCVERGTGGVAPNNSECRHSSAQPGNFGSIDFSYFGNEDLGTATSCSAQQQAQNARLLNNLAVGIDHDIAIRGTDARMVDTSICPSGLPNSAGGNTGNSVESIVGAGLYSGGTFSDGFGPRLTRYDMISGTPSWMTSTAPAQIGSYYLDNVALWQFLPTSEPAGGWDVPRSCRRDQFSAATTSAGTLNGPYPAGVALHLSEIDSYADRIQKLTERCLVHYQGQDWDDGEQMDASDPPCTIATNPTGQVDCTGLLPQPIEFDDAVFVRNSSTTDAPDLYDIQYSPRFGYVPQTTDPQANSVPADIVTFRALFIQRIYGACSQQGKDCELRFDPGVGYSLPNPPANLQGKADAVGVFVFPRGSLPNNLAEEGAPVQIGANRFVVLVR